MKRIFKIILAVLLLLLAIGGFVFLYAHKLSNPWNAKTIEGIPAPRGYARAEAPTGSEAAFLRSLPLKSKGSEVRLRAEWLFSQGCYSSIRFQNVGGRVLQYSGGGSRKALYNFLRRAYGVCSTTSVYGETTPRQIKYVEAGDVFVFPARNGMKYGHAIIVVRGPQGRQGSPAAC